MDKYSELHDLDRKDESVMQDYKASGAFKSKTDEGDLHMFFSPRRIPDGLTDEEVRICVQLYPRRKKLADRMIAKRKRLLREAWEKKLGNDWFLLEKVKDAFRLFFRPIELTLNDILNLMEIGIIFYEPISLPEHLIGGPMTRERFANGIAILIAKLERLEKTSS